MPLRTKSLLLIPLLSSACIVPDSMVDALLDADDDGERTRVVGGTDCDDSDASVGSTQPERCGNAIDDDCDGDVDEGGVDSQTWYVDADEDGYGDPEATVTGCEQPPASSTRAGDCDDRDRTRHPGATEDCTNGIDDDCDNDVDESDDPPVWWPDLDGDGYGDPDGFQVTSCTRVPEHATNDQDCDDRAATAYPGATEIPYDGIDNACDGGNDFDWDGDGFLVDPDLAPFPIADGDYRPAAHLQLDCDDQAPDVFPNAPDVFYDGVDSNCDGADDFDADADGHARIPEGGDCDDTTDAIHPDRPEIHYNNVDENCFPADDDDADLDGYEPPIRGGIDCDDEDPDNWVSCLSCDDDDGDGWFVGCDQYVDRDGPDCLDVSGFVEAVNVWQSCANCDDLDGDGRYAGCDQYVSVQEDCDDTEPRTWDRCDTCVDADGDGYLASSTCNQLLPGDLDDCDDALANAWDSCGGCVDADGDGRGVGACDTSVPQDCDDTDPDVDLSCATCVDLDGDGSRTGCDRHLRTPYDCNDNNPTIGGHVFEVPGDGIDQDCTGDDLVFDDAHAIFVRPAPLGVNTPTCGTQAAPCSTLQHAADRAFAEGKVVAAAAGSYAPVDTWVSLYGGFEPGTWTWDPSSYSTVITGDRVTAVDAHGAATAVEGVVVQVIGVPQRITVVDADATWFRLAESHVTGPEATDWCRGVRFTGHHAFVESTTLDGCTAWNQNIGLSLGLRNSEIDSAEVLSTIIAVVGSPSSSSVGIDQRAGHFSMSDSTVTVQTGASAIGVESPGEFRTSGSFAIDSCDIWAGISYSALSTTAVQTPTLPTVVIESSRIRAGLAPTAEGVRITDRPPTGSAIDIEYRLVNNLVDASATQEAFGVTAAVQSAESVLFEVLQNTVRVDAPDTSTGFFVFGDSTLLGVNNLIVSSDVGIEVPGPWTLMYNHFESPCPFRANGVCSNAPAINTCDLPSCAVATSNADGAAQLDPASDFGAVPMPNSPLVDAGIDATTWFVPPIDILGTVRPSGNGWDVGALESP